MAEITQTVAPLPTKTSLSTKTSLPTFTPTATIQPTPVGGGLGQIVYVSGSDVNILNLYNPETSETIGKFTDWKFTYDTFEINVSNKESIAIINEKNGSLFCSGLCDKYNGQTLQAKTLTSRKFIWDEGEDYKLKWPNCTLVRSFDGKLIFSCSEGYSSIYYPGGSTDTSRADYYPVWHPNGESFAYESFRSLHYEIVILDINTQEETRLTMNLDYDAYHPAWSADGSKIAFMLGKRNSKENSQICFVTIDDQKVTCITDSMTNKDYPAWSPDGQFLVYSEYLGGNYELMVIDINGKNTIQLTDNNVDDILGLWLR